MESHPAAIRYAKVILEVSIHKALDYAIPRELGHLIERGVCVEVPLRGGVKRGFVAAVSEHSEVAKPRAILRCLSAGPVVTNELFELALWMAKYYVCPLGKVLKTMLPAGVRKNTSLKQQHFISLAKTPKIIREACIEMRNKAPQQAAILDCLLMAEDGLLQTELLQRSSSNPGSIKSLADKGLVHVELVRQGVSPFVGEEYFKTKPKVLRQEQQEALQKILQTISSRRFETHLLFGITGSGKTEVYLQAIQQALEEKLGVIMLLPEISLTPQTLQHFKSRFDEPVAMLHHRLSDGERLDMWEKLRSGQCRICLGARSAIFCPMPSIGLIIVDEEHEQSYKQSDDSPCYSGRDVAIMRAKLSNACCVLGSATPSMESYHHACTGKYTLSVLRNRPEGIKLPDIHIVDMKHEYAKAKGVTLFSDLLLTKLEDRRAKGEATILFLNRRGYHTVLSCTACGKSISCPHCDATLTFHMSQQLVMCHLCGLHERPPTSCPSCHSHQMIQYKGVGTEKIEAMLHGIFPGITTTRIDADSTRHKGSMERLLQEFRSGKSEVLIGTQMVAKGLHFPLVTLVGVLNADSGLHIPDFRSQESTFQLITQVAGRAGRGYAPGEVIIQTSVPEQSTILQAAKQDYEAFFSEELETRKAFSFPPFCKIVKFLFTSKEEARVRDFASQYAETLAHYLPPSFYCHPAVPSGHARIKEQYRYQFLLRGPSIHQVLEAIAKADVLLPLPSSIFRFIDVDPSSTFF